MTLVELHFHKTRLFFISYVRGNPTASCCCQQHRNINTYIDQASHSLPGYEIGRSSWPFKTWFSCQWGLPSSSLQPWDGRLQLSGGRPNWLTPGRLICSKPPILIIAVVPAAVQRYLSNPHCWDVLMSIEKWIHFCCICRISNGKLETLLSNVHFSPTRKLSAECQHIVLQGVEDVPATSLFWFGLLWARCRRPIQRLLSP